MRIIRSLEEIPEIEKSVLTIGSFDGVHRGHQKIISRISQLANEIGGESVIITFHPHPRSIIYPKDKSLSLLNTLEEKIELMEHFGVDNLVIVPFTVEFSQMPPREYIEKFLLHYFQPAFIALGYDHRFGLNREGDINLLREYETSHNFKVSQIEVQEIEDITISSTKVRNAIKEAEMATAYQFLNYHYMISGKVAHGQKIGKELGFPTANIEIRDRDKLIPPDGIYAVFVNLSGKKYEGMLYIGNRPTLQDDSERRIEVNIFDFHKNIYGEDISLEIVMFIRDDKKFENIQKLKVQLHEDEQQSRLVLNEFQKRYSPQPSKVSIAILNYNAVDFLESYLPPILFSSTDPIDVIIADNGSEDGSVEYVTEWHPEIKLIQFTKNYGFAEGYNRTLHQIDSEYTVILNNDVLVTENWLDPIIKIMDTDPTIAACQPKIRSLTDPNMFEHAGAAGGYLDSLAYAYCKGRIFDEVEEDIGQYNTNEEIFWASGAAMIVRTKVFNNLGGFDSTYFAHYEEIDLCWRMKRAGYKIMAVNDSVIYHLGGGTLPYENSKKIYLNFRNSLKTLLKNDTSSVRLLKFLLRLILDGGAALLLFIKGQWKAIPTIIKAHWSVFLSMGEITKSRKKYNQLIAQYRIDKENKEGRYNGILPIQYYLFGKKKFKDL